jgi:hypothetical protein
MGRSFTTSTAVPEDSTAEEPIANPLDEKMTVPEAVPLNAVINAVRRHRRAHGSGGGEGGESRRSIVLQQVYCVQGGIVREPRDITDICVVISNNEGRQLKSLLEECESL